MQVTSILSTGRNRLIGFNKLGWIGVDIGSSGIKIAQVEPSGSAWRFSRRLLITASENSPPPETAESETAESETAESETAEFYQEWIEQELTKHRVQQTFRGRQTACLLPFSACDLRTLDMPEATEAELQEMVSQEIALDEEFDDQEMECGIWNSSHSEADQTKELKPISVLSVSSRLSEQFAQTLLNTGLQCQIVDGLPFALARAVGMTTSRSIQEPVAALDWGYESAVLTIVNSGKPTFTRVLRGCGFKLLVQSIADGLEVSLEESHLLLSSFGFKESESSESQSELRRAIEELAMQAVDNITAELSRTVSYLKQQRSPFVPERLILFGGGATIQNVSTTFAQRIGIPTSTWELASGGRMSGVSQATDSSMALFGPAAALSALGVSQ